MPPSDPLNHRIASLDCLRGLAAISVVVFHFTTWFHTNYGHDFEPWPWLYYLPYGVHLFFMLSGFVIVKSLDHGQGIGSFAVARVFRLLPGLWVAIPLTMISVHFLGPQDRAAGIVDAVANTLLIHEYFYLEHVDGAYWTLVLEVLFYAVTAGLFVIFRTNRRVILGLLLLVLPVGFLTLWLYQAPPSGPLYVLLDKLPRYYPMFVIGMALYDIYEARRLRLPTAALLCVTLAYVIVINDSDYRFVIYLAVALLLISIFYSRFLTMVPGLTFLGLISYPLYLVHQTVGYGVILFLYERGWTGLATIPVTMVLVIVLAYLISRYVERPALTYYKRRRAAQRRAAVLKENSRGELAHGSYGID